MTKVNFEKAVALSVGVLAMASLIGFLVFAWTEPSQAPPGGNVPAPINVGSTAQTKTGNLTLPNLYLNAVDNEGNIYSTNIIQGYNDLILYGSSAKNVPIYLEGNPVVINNDAGTGNVGIGTTNPGTYKLNVNGTVATGDLTVGGGTGKINSGTVDPIFEIDGKKYGTYMADFAGGTRVETSGTIELRNGRYEIDFNNLEEGSNLWLFWQASNKNLKDVAVLLTPAFNGRVWYEKNGNSIIIYGERDGEVSFRLSSPRVDYQDWPNLVKDQNLIGIKVAK